MRPVTVLHCSDLHLGRVLPQGRSEELQMTFEDLILLGEQRKADLFLIAGDLFDQPVPERELVEFVRSRLAKLPENMTVAIAPGNHDFICSGSPYLNCDWGKRVKILTGQPVQLENLPVTLWGAAFHGSYQTQSLLEGVRLEPDGRLHIGVLHGDLVSDRGQSNYDPLPPWQIAQSGLHYLALGHIHQRSELHKAGTTAYCYCGAPEGFGFGEPGELGALISEVSEYGTRLEFVPLCRRMYLRHTIPVTGLDQPHQVTHRVLLQLEQQYGKDYPRHFYRLALTGEWSGSPDLAKRVQTRLEETLHWVQVEDQTMPDADKVLVAEEDSLKGLFVRQMLERIHSAQGEEQQQYQQALRLGLAAFEGEVTL